MGRDAWVAELSGADTCVTPVLSVAELVDDEQYAARHAIVEVVADADAVGPSGTAPPARFRQVGPVLAGMVAPDGPVVVPDQSRTDTDALLAAAGLAPEGIADLRDRGVVA
jgi:alpha-methylacyl-CoA racemase